MELPIDAQRQELFDLCRKYRVKHLELFGSALSSEFDVSRSDLDFLVEFQTASPSEHANCYFGLLQALEDLFKRKIDLVENRAIRNPYFQAGIDKSCKMIYAG